MKKVTEGMGSTIKQIQEKLDDSKLNKVAIFTVISYITEDEFFDDKQKPKLRMSGALAGSMETMFITGKGIGQSINHDDNFRMIVLGILYSLGQNVLPMVLEAGRINDINKVLLNEEVFDENPEMLPLYRQYVDRTKKED